MKKISLQTAKQLKEAGFPQESEFYWWMFEGEPQKLMPSDWALDERRQNDERYEFYAAPTAEEVLERLPEHFMAKDADFRSSPIPWFLYIYPSHGYVKDTWKVVYKSETGTEHHYFSDKSVTEAAAQMWLYLKEKGLLA